jgi:hypothetical protein
MPDRQAHRRPATALDFAIVASLAVLPVMMAVVWLVAVVRPADGAAAPEHHVSSRQVTALRTFESAVVPRPSAPALPTPRQVLDGVPACRAEWGGGFDLRRWIARKFTGSDTVDLPLAEKVAAQLGTLDRALRRFSTTDNARVAQPVGLDAGRWFAAAQTALAGPARELTCADLAAALAALLRADARMLQTLSWRGTTGAATLAKWPAEQWVAFAETSAQRRNPWAGAAGCVFLGAGAQAPTYAVAAPRSVQRRVCAGAGVQLLAGDPGPDTPADDARWGVPPSLPALLQPLEALRLPSHALYRRLAEPAAGAHGVAAHQVQVDGAPIDVGYSVALTIDPALQALAQRTAACYTGRHDVCAQLQMQRSEDRAPLVVGQRVRPGAAVAPPRPLGDALLEGAMVRMAAVAVIDIASGRIEALAGTMSPCARQEVDGPGRAAHCDRRLPFAQRYRADALLNPALFHGAMPASTIKPMMATAFFADPLVGARWLAAEQSADPNAPPPRQSLRGQLVRSDSARFLDRMFCADAGFGECRRGWDIQAGVTGFGWNAGCADGGGLDCGKRDLLFGRAPASAPADGPVLLVSYGRLMAEPVRPGAGALHLMPPARFERSLVQRCALGVDGKRASDDDWEKCRGGALVDVVAEGWGQGHARASALGVAGMMASLAAAANGARSVPRPHLVSSVTRADGKPAMQMSGPPSLSAWRAAPAEPITIAPDAAALVLGALAHTHRAGTARSACAQVFDAARCRDIGWIAGKTGTPSFPSDGVGLDELASLCRTLPPHAAAVEPAERTARRKAVCSSLRPYKWYVAAYREDGSAHGPWTKAIAVLTERNWLRRNGQVHGSGDQGPNPAAEIALQIAGRRVGALASPALVATGGPP